MVHVMVDETPSAPLMLSTYFAKNEENDFKTSFSMNHECY
jgi:hypothetical protein